MTCRSSRKLNIRFWLIIALLSVCGNAYSNEGDSDYDDLKRLSLKALLQIKVNTGSRTEARQRYQPSSMTVIHRQEIRQSSARTVNDLLNTYVPGYFKAEDKDDTIAAFRGVAPDNNSKVLFLINGVKINADWFWGPADSILNGIDLNYIERIEIVRGPGSVTLGQGAQLGVINIITRRNLADFELTAGSGSKGWRQLSLMGGATQSEHNLDWYFSHQALDGFDIRPLGWGIEVTESDSAHPAPAAERGNRLNRNRATRLLLNYDYQDLRLTLQHHRQHRDLYNWTKDRDQIEQRFTLAGVEYGQAINEDWSYLYSADWQQDDYALYDHTFNLVTGGARETRANGNAEVKWLAADGSSVWISGLEVTQFKTGHGNWRGDNFIVNRVSNINPENNQLNQWVFNNRFTTSAAYSEFSHTFKKRWHANWGVRYDKHPNWGSHVSPRASLIYESETSSNLYRLTYSEGFRGAPGVHYSGGFLRDGLLSESNFNALDGTGMTSSTTGELLTSLPRTKPEELANIEFAIKGELNPNWSYDVIFYNNRLKNLIIDQSTRNGIPESPVGTDIVGLWGGVFYFTNAVGELNINGLEISSRYRTGQMDHAFSYSQSHIVSADGFEFGQKSPVAGSVDSIHSNGLPEKVFRYQANWRVNEFWSLAYQHTQIGDWWSPWTNQKASGFGWGNVRLSWQISDNDHLQLQVGNIWQQNNLYPIRARGRNNETAGAPNLEPRSFQLSYTKRFE